MEVHLLKDLSCGKCPRNFETVLFWADFSGLFLFLLNFRMKGVRLGNEVISGGLSEN